MTINGEYKKTSNGEHKKTSTRELIQSGKTHVPFEKIHGKKAPRRCILLSAIGKQRYNDLSFDKMSPEMANYWDFHSTFA